MAFLLWFSNIDGLQPHCSTRFSSIERRLTLLDGELSGSLPQFVIAYYDGKQKGGTYYTCREARKRGMTVVNLF